MDNRYIDPAEYRFRNAWRQLTAVRLVVFVARLLGRLFHFIGEMGFRVLRGFGLSVIDSLYAFKLKLVDLKYSTRRRRLSLTALIFSVFSFLWLIPKGIGLMLAGLFGLFKEGAKRSKAGVVEEARRTFTPPPPQSRRSIAWSMVNFILTLALVLAPVIGYAEWRKLDVTKGDIFASVKAAVDDLFSAKDFLEQQNIAQARHAFTKASGNFLKAREDISSINGVLLALASVVPAERFQLAASTRHLAAAGELSARLGERLTAAMALPAGTAPSAAAFLDNFLREAEAGLPLAKDLQKELGKISPEALPEEYRDDFKGLAGKAEFLVASLSESIDVAKQAQKFLGKEMDKRYLLVFQNNSEKRASGGFIGSYALVDLSKGEISGLTVPKGGSYDTEAGLSRLVAAPQPLALLNPLWHFWDANWWPDWPTSASKLMWFYEKSNGPTVDGVISLTPTVIEKALRVIGPIDMTKDYGVVIDADNFWEVTQTFSEQKPDVTKEPKKIIGDLIDKIIEEIPKRMNPQLAVRLIGVLEDSFAEKQALLYFSDPELEGAVRRFGWGGEQLPAKGDYLMVVNTNIGGQKSDRAIRESIDQSVRILPDGSIIDTLTIRREHTAPKGQLFVGVRNVDWLRVYVPQGSELLEADGFRSPDAALFSEPDLGWEKDPLLAAESAAQFHQPSGTKMYDEKDKTVFANWSMIDPGETAVIRLSYRLPFTVDTATRSSGWFAGLKDFISSPPSPAYSLLVQKQPGADASAFAAKVVSEKNLKAAWQYPEGWIADGNSWTISAPLASDLFSALLFQP